MPTDFPGGVDDIQNDVSNSTVLTDLHPSLHNDLADAVMALETQVLAGGGTVADGSITSAKIADGTIVAGDIADGAVTSAKILDGTIATADLANASVTNAKLASDTARANLLTNGGFELWQRGNGPFTAGYTADRWDIALGAGSTLSVSQNTANADTGSMRCAALSYTHSAESYLRQILQETDALGGLKGRTITASIRVRVSTPNAVRVMMFDSIGGLTYGSYHTGSGAYETLTLTKTIASGSATATVSVAFNANCTAYIDNAMLVVGSVAADYAPLHPADDLARCLRYYETIGGTAGEYLAAGQCLSATLAFFPLRFRQSKAVTATVTLSAATAFNALNSGGGGLAGTSASAASTTASSTNLNFNVASGLIAGNAVLIQAGGAAGSINFEANP